MIEFIYTLGMLVIVCCSGYKLAKHRKLHPEEDESEIFIALAACVLIGAIWPIVLAFTIGWELSKRRNNEHERND